MKSTKMCNKNNQFFPKSAMKNKKNKKKKEQNNLVSSKPFRRARSKIKKPKFLSLSNTQLQMQQQSNPKKKQLNLFPEHPDPDPDPPESMADHMFSEDGPGPTTLTGLLNGAVSSTTTTTSSGLSYATVAYDSVNSARSLVRSAMRRREESEEERWVSISDMVEKRSDTVAAPTEVAEEEVTSGGGGGGGRLSMKLKLKLDYEEVLNAWSGSNGPFYVKPENNDDDEDELPQTVPDLCFDRYGVVPFWGVTNNGQWRVPEYSFNGQNSSRSQIGGSTGTGEEVWKMGIREASVLRYKEKRQNRLFAKRIRYEVRKLNAEKRPRIKGRFVKRGVD